MNSKFDLFWLLWLIFYFLEKKRQQTTTDNKSPKKFKKPSLIAEYTSSENETSGDEENVDDIDELLNEVLDKEEKIDKKVQQVDLYPLFEADCRAAIARLIDLHDKTPEIFTLRIQLEVQKIFIFLSEILFFNYLDTFGRLSCWSSIKILCC
jgi:hypothetical protein